MSSNVCFCLDLKSKPRQNTPAEFLLFSFCLHATDLPLGQSGSLHKVRQHSQHGAFWRPQMHPGIFKVPPASFRRTPLVRFCTCELHESSPCSLDGPCLLCPLCFWSPSPTSSPRSFHNDIIHVRGGREGRGGGEGARLWHAKSQIQTDLIWEWQKHVAGYDKRPAVCWHQSGSKGRFVTRQKPEFTESLLHNGGNIWRLFLHDAQQKKLPVWTKIHICSVVNAQHIPA